MNILKKYTKSVCPECCKEISARVYEEKGKVYMYKNCSFHGDFKILIENDAWVYKKLMNKKGLPQQCSFDSMMIAITHRCNIDCPVCYMPNKNIPDLTLEEIKKIIFQSDARLIRLSGGEPTLHDNITQIIQFVYKSGRIPAIVTNGLKLSDRSYLKRLKQAGLKRIHFSFNGFDDAWYEKIHGCKLLKIKMKALDNIRKERMQVTLGIMLSNETNENDLRKIYRFYLKNRQFIFRIRIRAVVPVGKTKIIDKQIYLSDMIVMIAKIIGVSKEDVVEHSLSSSSYFKQPHNPCCVNIELISLLLQSLKLKGGNSSVLIKMLILFKLFSRIGLRNTFNATLSRIKGREMRRFQIFIRIWHDKYRIDLDELTRCHSSHFVTETGRIVPLCYGYAMNTHTLFL